MIDWLLSPASRSLEPGALLLALVDRLVAAGVPVRRAATSVPTRHPEVSVENLQVRVPGGLRRVARPRLLTQLDDYAGSPVAAIHGGRLAEIRRRLPDPSGEFALLDTLAADGLTDYLVLALPTSSAVSFLSFATDAPAGFDEAALAALRALVPAFSLRLELSGASASLRSLLEVYLGANAATRVLAGAFHRGGGEALRAAIWFCDMRGFTAFADARPPVEVVRVLDRLFERVADAIDGKGGEILKFVGDAVLAVFPLGGEGDPDVRERDACRRALAAAEQALGALGAERDDGTLAGAQIGVALHFGDVFYGNIGARARLDFTVIGAAVNEVCRVEALTKPLGRPLLVTRAFAERAADPRLVALGGQAVKGVAQPIDVFAL